jgi:hypothetical protein
MISVSFTLFFHSLMEDTRDIFWYDFKYDAIFLVVSGLYKICMVLVVTFVLGSPYPIYPSGLRLHLCSSLVVSYLMSGLLQFG